MSKVIGLLICLAIFGAGGYFLAKPKPQPENSFSDSFTYCGKVCVRAGGRYLTGIAKDDKGENFSCVCSRKPLTVDEFLPAKENY